MIDCGFEIDAGLRMLIAAKESHPSSIVVLISDDVQEEKAVQAYRAGVREFLRNPVSPDELSAILTRLLEFKKQARETRTPFVSTTATGTCTA